MTLLAASIVAKLDLFAEKKHAMLRPGRDYLGASVIGHACDAYCAMDMRDWPTKKKGSTIRAGDLGHLVEGLVIDWLCQIGLTVMSVDPKTGEQFEFTSHHGKFRCHPDGFVAVGGQSYVLEVKSAKRSRFLKMKGKGVREGDRLYYDQVMTAMGMSKVHKTLFVVFDKDSGEFHVEIIDFDMFHWAYIQTKIDRIIDGGAEKVSTSPDYWRCKQCDRAMWCWSKKPPVGSWMPQERAS